jgi:16S rRNA (uracil1498-N3)-methyltransferase
MHRVCVDPGLLSATRLTLPKAVAHYIATVLRLRPGDEIGVFDGTGREGCVRLTSVSSASVQGEVVAIMPQQPALTPLVFGQALPKHPKMDFIVEKCSELGLTTLVPLYTVQNVQTIK